MSRFTKLILAASVTLAQGCGTAQHEPSHEYFLLLGSGKHKEAAAFAKRESETDLDVWHSRALTLWIATDQLETALDGLNKSTRVGTKIQSLVEPRAWRRVRTHRMGRMSIRSPFHRESVTFLETVAEFDSWYEEVAPSGGSAPPLLVMIHPNRRAYAANSGQRAYGGYFDTETGVVHLLWNKNPDATYRILAHEAFHHWTLSWGHSLPPWAEEGLADCFAGCANKHSPHLGDLNPWRATTIRKTKPDFGWEHWASVRSLTREDFTQGARSENAYVNSWFYAWALRRDPRSRALFQEYLFACSRGIDEPLAFSQTLAANRYFLRDVIDDAALNLPIVKATGKTWKLQRVRE